MFWIGTEIKGIFANKVDNIANLPHLWFFLSDKAEDNLEFGTKKYFKQSFKTYADIVQGGLKKGYGKLTQSDIDILSRRFDKLKLITW